MRGGAGGLTLLPSVPKVVWDRKPEWREKRVFGLL